MLLATNSNQKRKDQNVEILGALYVHSIFIAGTTQKLLCQALVWHTLQVSTQTKAQLSDVFWWCSWRNGYQELEQVHRHQMKDQGLTKHHEHRCLLSCQRIPIHTKLTSTTISTLIKISFKILLKNCHRNITYWIEITDCGGVGGGEGLRHLQIYFCHGQFWHLQFRTNTCISRFPWTSIAVYVTELPKNVQPCQFNNNIWLQ